jgi:hypothetical protein
MNSVLSKTHFAGKNAMGNVVKQNIMSEMAKATKQIVVQYSTSSKILLLFFCVNIITFKMLPTKPKAQSTGMMTPLHILSSLCIISLSLYVELSKDDDDELFITISVQFIK